MDIDGEKIKFYKSTKSSEDITSNQILLFQEVQ